jgi:hypothetical protein
MSLGSGNTFRCASCGHVTDAFWYSQGWLYVLLKYCVAGSGWVKHKLFYCGLCSRKLKIPPSYDAYGLPVELGMTEPEESLIWQLLPGDRVLHFDVDRIGSYPEGMIFRVDPSASFFPYWVKWDQPWAKSFTEGAFQSASFAWTKMAERGMRPMMTSERRKQLEELRVAQRKAAKRPGNVRATCRCPCTCGHAHMDDPDNLGTCAYCVATRPAGTRKAEDG